MEQANIKLIIVLVIGIASLIVGTIIAFVLVSNVSDIYQDVDSDTTYSATSSFLSNVTTTTLSPIDKGISSYSASTYNQTWLDFDGVNDYVDIINSTSYNLNGSSFLNGFTISNWILPKGFGEGNAGRIVDKSDGSNVENGFAFGMSTTNRTFFKINGGTARYSSDGSVNLSNTNWYHVAVTVSSGQLANFYVNGVLSGNANQDLVQTLSTITSNNYTRIGNRANTTVNSFNGSIDNLLIFNEVLSSNEIKYLYEVGR